MKSLNKWIISDITGKDIFYFEIFEMDGIICFDSNLVFQNKHTVIISYIERIIMSKLPLDELENIATLLFKAIKMNSFYKQFYFSDSILNRNGKFHSASYNILNKIYLDKLCNSNNKLIPFSKHYDFDLFKSLEIYYYSNRTHIDNSSIILNKTDFENQLITDLLKEYYLNVYDSSNAFHLHIDQFEIKTYFVLKNRKLIFAFIA